MMSAGTVVQMISRRVLPWMFGPSRPSSPGRWRNSLTAKSTTTTTSTKTGTAKMSIRSHRSSIFLACVEPCTGNQSM